MIRASRVWRVCAGTRADVWNQHARVFLPRSDRRSRALARIRLRQPGRARATGISFAGVHVIANGPGFTRCGKRLGNRRAEATAVLRTNARACYARELLRFSKWSGTDQR